MGQFELLKRTIDASMNIGQMTSARAKEIVNDMVKEGELQKDKSAKAVEAILERSKKNSEAAAAFVSREVKRQVALLNLVGKDDVEKIIGKVISDARTLIGMSKPSRSSSTASKVVASSSATSAKKAPAKKASGKKTVAKKAPAKKAAVKKAAVKKAAVKKAVAKKAPAKKATAKKTVAKK